MGAESLRASRTNLVEVEANNAKEAYHERLSNCYSITEQGYSSISEHDSPASTGEITFLTYAYVPAS